ncbi:hypothetical protein C8J57DRAFT_1223215 [Mycena rebaudengoi]|nr:hypothetical protein C8J57DRAFT_1223215 [Mycena rebaudengoi]
MPESKQNRTFGSLYSPSSKSRATMSHTDTRPTQSSETRPANVGADQTVQKSASSPIPEGQTRYDGKDASIAPTVQTQPATLVEDHAGPGKSQGKFLLIFDPTTNWLLLAVRYGFVSKTSEFTSIGYHIILAFMKEQFVTLFSLDGVRNYVGSNELWALAASATGGGMNAMHCTARIGPTRDSLSPIHFNPATLKIAPGVSTTFCYTLVTQRAFHCSEAPRGVPIHQERFVRHGGAALSLLSLRAADLLGGSGDSSMGIHVGSFTMLARSLKASAFFYWSELWVPFRYYGHSVYSGPMRVWVKEEWCHSTSVKA